MSNKKYQIEYKDAAYYYKRDTNIWYAKMFFGTILFFMIMVYYHFIEFGYFPKFRLCTVLFQSGLMITSLIFFISIIIQWRINVFKTKRDERILAKKNKTYNHLVMPSNKLIKVEEDLKLELFRLINQGRMQIEGRVVSMCKDGLEYKTPVGDIDLLTTTEDTVYVIELKNEKRTADKVVGQVMRYTGFLKNHSKGKKIVPVVLAKDINSKLLAACYANKEILLYQHFQFTGTKDMIIQKYPEIDDMMINEKTNFYSKVDQKIH